MNKGQQNKEKSNNWIYMIGAIRECPVKDRDQYCSYKPFLHLSLKEASSCLEYLPEDKKTEMVNYCKNCSYLKQCQEREKA